MQAFPNIGEARDEAFRLSFQGPALIIEDGLVFTVLNPSEADAAGVVHPHEYVVAGFGYAGEFWPSRRDSYPWRESIEFEPPDGPCSACDDTGWFHGDIDNPHFGSAPCHHCNQGVPPRRTR